MKTYTKLFTQAFRSIFNNKARSFLTMLGIAIAVFVVVAVDAISNGLAQSTTNRFSNLDATRITVTSQVVTESSDEDSEEQPRDDGAPLRQVAGGNPQVEDGSESLTYEDLADILLIDNVVAASPIVSTQTQVELLDESTARVTINGVDVMYEALEDLSYEQGAFFTETQVSAADSVIVIDYTLATGLFESAEAAIGQSVTLNDQEYSIVGVLEEPDEENTGFGGPGGRGGGTSIIVYTPYTTALAATGSEKIASIVAETDTEDEVETAATEILALLYDNHGVNEDDSDVTITTAADALDTISGITAAQSKSDKFIGWIVLLVGGIGIMNIMLVTVSERTREIGLRKAVGAKGRHIVSQFLTESILLTTIGGSVGLLTAILMSGQVTDIFEIQTGGPGGRGGGADSVAIVDANTVLVALGVSIIAGVIFGLYPAIKASRKDPVESLRYE